MRRTVDGDNIRWRGVAAVCGRVPGCGNTNEWTTYVTGWEDEREQRRVETMHDGQSEDNSAV